MQLNRQTTPNPLKSLHILVRKNGAWVSEVHPAPVQKRLGGLAGVELEIIWAIVQVGVLPHEYPVNP